MGLLDRVDFKQSRSAPPEEIDLTADGRLRIRWQGGDEATVAFKALREACPCAECVEEWTGRKLLDPAKVAADVRPAAIDPVGSYAIRISWSDGHASGIYTWDLLRRVSAA